MGRLIIKYDYLKLFVQFKDIQDALIESQMSAIFLY
jgi:hypothetical protein